MHEQVRVQVENLLDLLYRKGPYSPETRREESVYVDDKKIYLYINPDKDTARQIINYLDEHFSRRKRIKDKLKLVE